MVSETSAPRVSFGFPGFSRQIVIVAALMLGALALGLSVAALIVRLSPVSAPGIVEAAAHPGALPLLPAMAPDSPAPATLAQGQGGAGSATRLAAASPAPDDPIRIASPPPKLSLLPPPKDAPLPPPRPLALIGPAMSPAGPFDHWTAVYDLTAHTVYMPDGTRLEAHSGLGDRLDNPRYVGEKDRGATPPHLYDLALREEPFHGVQALRLNPVGGDGAIFGRVGLLAHTYMLGPKGDSNGCVSFKDYDAFLQAFESGKVKRLAVVASLD